MALMNQNLVDHLLEQKIPITSTQTAIDALLEWVISTRSNIDREKLRKKIQNYMGHLSDKWRKSARNYHQLITRFSSWVQTEFHLPIEDDAVIEATNSANPSSSKGGRPLKSIVDSSLRSKRRKIKSKYGETETEELLLAAQSSLIAEGKRSQAHVIAIASTSEGAQKISECMKRAEKFDSIHPFTPEEALIMMLDCNMSKNTYRIQRKLINSKLGLDFIPSYDRVVAEKRKCYPADIKITSEGAVIPLQSILNNTATRIAESICDNYPDDEAELTLICKYGCDGSGGHSQYMQKPLKEKVDDASEDELNEDEVEENEQEIDDTCLLLISIAPLCLKTNQGKLIWENKTPNSPRFCRPIRFVTKKETTRLVLAEMGRLNEEINSLQNVNLCINEKIFPCAFQLLCTMLDVKTVNTLTNNASTQTCHLCYSKPTQMNQLSSVQHKSVIVENMQYGLSTLHGWVKMMEYVLHISYKLHVKQPTIRGLSVEQKTEMALIKQTVLEKLAALGMLIDRVVLGKGTSNTGNVARKFFRQHTTVSEITGVDHDCIKRMYIIMVTLTCGKPLNIPAFQIFCEETANKLVQLYPWYRMPVSVHKILIHGAQVAESMPLPVGMLSEEASEAANKIYRAVREHHTRKAGRGKTFEDLICYMLAYSDPKLSEIRRPARESLHLPEEVFPLLITPTVTDCPPEDVSDPDVAVVDIEDIDICDFCD